MLIYKNDYIEISSENDKVYLNTLKAGFSLKDFDQILRNYPRVKLTNFSVLKSVLSKESKQKNEIGHLLPNIEIEISRDKMIANLIIYELHENKEEMKDQINQLINQNNIVYGIKELDFQKIIPGKPYVIAQGTSPQKGEDAKITYLEIPERKPVIREDGKANYFDMNFIFEIKKDDWLGEKIPPTKGVQGTNIFGEMIPAQPGKDLPLKYDRTAAHEVEENGKIVIRACKEGVLEEKNGIISVNHHLPIHGDVGYETGNIKFDGTITISGTVQPGFSVEARGDISIEDIEGVSDAKFIKSHEGDIYIRGGIFGMGKTKVEAGGSIFVKHVNDANLVAKKDIVIGSYALGSFLQGNSILLDDRKGKIIGGRAVAKYTIVTAISGNHLERRTELIIKSLNKEEGLEETRKKSALLKTAQEEIIHITSKKNQLEEIRGRLNAKQLHALKMTKELLNKKIEEAKLLNDEIKDLINEFQHAGKKEIVVTKEAHPGTYIQIGKKSALLTKLTNGTFLLESGELNV